MKTERKILNYMNKNQGTITTKEITKKKFHREYLRILEKKGLIEKVDRGVYILPNYFEDHLYVQQQRHRKGIFSHGTALYLHQLTDRTPIKYTMTFPNSYNTSKVLKEGINVYQTYPKYLTLDTVEVETNNGNKIITYSMEKTLCDIIRGNSKLSVEEVSGAFKKYAQRNDKNITKLLELSKTLRVEKKVRTYLEVLL